MLALPLHSKTFLGSQQGGKNPSSGKVSLSTWTALHGAYRSAAGKNLFSYQFRFSFRNAKGREKPRERESGRKERMHNGPFLLLLAHSSAGETWVSTGLSTKAATASRRRSCDLPDPLPPLFVLCFLCLHLKPCRFFRDS